MLAGVQLRVPQSSQFLPLQVLLFSGSMFNGELRPQLGDIRVRQFRFLSKQLFQSGVDLGITLSKSPRARLRIE